VGMRLGRRTNAAGAAERHSDPGVDAAAAGHDSGRLGGLGDLRAQGGERDRDRDEAQAGADQVRKVVAGVERREG